MGNASSAKCGKISKADKDAQEAELLAGRLKVRAPAGAKAPAPQPELPAAEEESRLVVDHVISFAIVAKETFQLDPDMYDPDPDAPSKPGTLDVEAPKFLKATMASVEPLDVTPVEIAGMRAYAARPKNPNAEPGKDTALVLGLLIAQDDGTLESVGFYVRGEPVRNATGSDLVGCTRLAERVASTITAGSRKLERAAGPRHIASVPPDQELVISAPADYVAVPTTTGGAKITKLRPLSLYAGSIAISLADSKKDGASGDATAKGTLFGRPTEWRGQSSPKGGFFFAAEPVDANEKKSKIAEVLVKATRQAKALDEMRSVAETLTLMKRH
jgi:hypothetical protein